MATPLPLNHAAFTDEEIRLVTGARVLAVPAHAVTSVVTDSRAVVPGSLFVALAADPALRLEHARKAVAQRAAAVIVTAPFDGAGDAGVYLVDDAVKALGDLAGFHRRRWSARAHGQTRLVVGITGSAGKTTTRRSVAAMLARIGTVHATQGNLNNLVGLPLVLLGLDDSHEVCVVELGMSVPGEIARLAEIAAPDVGVLTLVAKAHLEGVGSLAGIAMEKGSLFAAAREVAIVNGDDLLASAQLARARAPQWLTYGRGEHDLRVIREVPTKDHGTELTLGGPLLEGEELKVRTPLLGKAGVYATLAAVATACALVDEPLTQDMLDGVFDTLDDGAENAGDARLRLVRLPSGALLLDDAYNANGASMLAGLETAAAIAKREKRRLVLVLGEMRELGAESATEHDRVAEAAAALRPGALFGVQGEAARFVDRAAAKGLTASFEKDAAAAVKAVRNAVQPRDLVFLKGSRSVGLEIIARALSSAAAGESKDA